MKKLFVLFSFLLLSFKSYGANYICSFDCINPDRVDKICHLLYKKTDTGYSNEDNADFLVEEDENHLILSREFSSVKSDWFFNTKISPIKSGTLINKLNGDALSYAFAQSINGDFVYHTSGVRENCKKVQF